MPELLTDILCGIGAMYLAIHVGSFARTVIRRCRPSVPALAPRPGFNPQSYETERTMHEVRTS